MAFNKDEYRANRAAGKRGQGAEPILEDNNVWLDNSIDIQVLMNKRPDIFNEDALKKAATTPTRYIGRYRSTDYYLGHNLIMYGVADETAAQNESNHNGDLR